jgi:competence protein ComEC
MIDINNGDDLSEREVEEILAGREDSLAMSLKLALSPLLGGKRIEVLQGTGIDPELTNPIKFLHEKYPGEPIFRYIQSHPDLDHMRGLAALLDSGIQIINFWDCPHDKNPEFRDGEDKADWDAYLQLGKGERCVKALSPKRGDVQKYFNQNEDGSRGGDGISVLSPTSNFHADCRQCEDTNNSSYVLQYRSGDTTVIFGGDAEEKAWEEIYEVYGEEILSKCNVLKASHHGRDSGYYQQAVKAMNPQFTIVSAGKKPDTEVCAKYSQYCPNVWTTRWMGNIHLEIPTSGGAVISPDRDA